MNCLIRLVGAAACRVFPIFAFACASVCAAAEPGLVGEYYSGFKVTDGVIVFDGLSLVKTQVDKSFDFWNGSAYFNWDPIGGGNFSVHWTGCFYAPTSGRYGFGTISDDGSQIFLDGHMLLNNGESQWFDWQETYTVLGAGYHLIEITYYDSAVYSGIEVWFLPPGLAESSLPYSGEDFHHTPPTFNADTKWTSLDSQNLLTEPPAPAAKLNCRYRSDITQVEVSWMSSANAWYQLESSQDLLTWQKMEGPITGTGELILRNVEPVSHEFFRVLAFPIQGP